MTPKKEAKRREEIPIATPVTGQHLSEYSFIIQMSGEKTRLNIQKLHPTHLSASATNETFSLEKF
ncbi:CLUMA_CG019756, isoform A [Clunio marinus]|uniref:CLUMA_CG019756, isoform A n=1 Tax=Clunio marinus TaxID=568069 RepID=A0A1J1J516_9DIPT|nr:CLUMA_CG019756, isoform A [Clunio marinus]